jgi:hypothetical protein
VGVHGAWAARASTDHGAGKVTAIAASAGVLLAEDTAALPSPERGRGSDAIARVGEPVVEIRSAAGEISHGESSTRRGCADDPAD